MKGVGQTAKEMLKGHSLSLLLDKLGERLAFERTGVRLYQAALAKLDAASAHAGGPTRAELEELRDQELAHMRVLTEGIVGLGADPTTVTPGADVTGTLSAGIVQVLTDPRSTLTQCLEALLVVELADNDSWRLLQALAEGMGHGELAGRFAGPIVDEEDHLRRVRRWLGAALAGQAGIGEEALRFDEHRPPA